MTGLSVVEDVGADVFSTGFLSFDCRYDRLVSSNVLMSCWFDGNMW